MKSNKITVCLIAGLFMFTSAFAQQKNETIKVWGNCGMCKTTIEKAAKKAGATTASWNEESHLLTVKYAAAKTSSAKIQQAIAKTGYDTQDYKADDKTYNKLHGCCKYERKDSKASVNSCCDLEGCGSGVDCCKGKECCKDKKCEKKQ